MDNHGRNRAQHISATADGQRAAPHVYLASWLLATLLTVACGHDVLAKDAEPSATVQRIKSQFSKSSESRSQPQTEDALPGIRQPDFTTPVGGVAEEADEDQAPADTTSKGSGKASSEAAKKAFGKTSTKKATPKSESTWSSLWREVFASDSPSSAGAAPNGKSATSSGGIAEQLASHTAGAADELFQRPTPPKNPQLAEQEQNTQLPEKEDEAAPPADGIEEPAAEPRAPRLFKLAETVVESGNRSGVFGLSRQMAMRSDAEPVQESPVAGEAMAQQPSERRHPLNDSSLLLPFQVTNPAPASSRGAASGTSGSAPSQAPQGVFYASPFGMLSGQLRMSTGTNYRTLAESVAEAPMLSEQAEGDDGWGFDLPTMSNPLTLKQDPASAWSAGEGARLAAYQETLPAPPDQAGEDAFRDDAGQDNTGGDGESKTLADAERVGEEPEDNTLQFLRTQTVLLEPGESQCDIGINYLFSENRFPVLLLDDGIPVGADDVLFRIRELTFPLEYRVGLLKRVQGFIGAPIGWSNTQVALGEYEQFENDGGFGDLEFGTTIQVIDGNAECPHGLFTIAATAPTGGDPFGPVPVLAQSAPSLGQGFWSISATALCIQTYDPIVFFYGLGAEHYFSRHFNGREIELGNSWNYLFGVGFAVNDRVTLSTRFFGSYIEETRVNRERILGTNVEPMTIRMAATISKPCDRIVEPFVEFGLTESAVESFFGITWTY